MLRVCSGSQVLESPLYPISSAPFCERSSQERGVLCRIKDTCCVRCVVAGNIAVSQVGDVKIDDVLCLMGNGQRAVDVSDVGPRAAVKRLRRSINDEGLNGCCETARVQALLGSCPRSV